MQSLVLSYLYTYLGNVTILQINGTSIAAVSKTDPIQCNYQNQPIPTLWGDCSAGKGRYKLPRYIYIYMCQGWSTPYIGDKLIPPRVLMGIQHTKLYHEVDDHPVWTPAHILILADSVKPWRDTTSRHITFVLVFWLFREVTLRCDTVKLENWKEGRITRSCFWLPFFFRRSSKVCQQFWAWPRCANDSNNWCPTFHLHLWLVVSSQFEKYSTQWIISWTSRAKIKNVWNHHLVTYLFNIAFIATPQMREAIENTKRQPEKIKKRSKAPRCRKRETT